MKPTRETVLDRFAAVEAVSVTDEELTRIEGGGIADPDGCIPNPLGKVIKEWISKWLPVPPIKL